MTIETTLDGKILLKVSLEGNGVRVVTLTVEQAEIMQTSLQLCINNIKAMKVKH